MISGREARGDVSLTLVKLLIVKFKSLFVFLAGSIRGVRSVSWLCITLEVWLRVVLRKPKIDFSLRLVAAESNPVMV